MEEKERIKVFVEIHHGETVCICCAANKKCDKECEHDIVERDRFRGWQKMFFQDRFGH